MNRNDLCVDILPHWHTAVDRCHARGTSNITADSSSTSGTGHSRSTSGSADLESSTLGVSTVTGVDVESAAALLRSCCKLLRMDLAEGC